MSTRLAAVCILGLGCMAGVVALPLGSSMASHPPSADQTQSHMRSHSRPYGTAPASFSIADNHCMSFVTEGANPPQNVVKGDPRFHPCSPTVQSFGIVWNGSPTAAQARAMSQVLDDLAIHRPDISLVEARPIIHAAVDNAT